MSVRKLYVTTTHCNVCKWPQLSLRLDYVNLSSVGKFCRDSVGSYQTHSSSTVCVTLLIYVPCICESRALSSAGGLCYSVSLSNTISQRKSPSVRCSTVHRCVSVRVVLSFICCLFTFVQQATCFTAELTTVTLLLLLFTFSMTLCTHSQRTTIQYEKIGNSRQYTQQRELLTRQRIERRTKFGFIFSLHMSFPQRTLVIIPSQRTLLTAVLTISQMVFPSSDVCSLANVFDVFRGLVSLLLYVE